MYKWIVFLTVILVIELVFKEIQILAALPLLSAGLIVFWYQGIKSKYQIHNLILVISLFGLAYTLLIQLNPGVFLAAFGVAIMIEGVWQRYATGLSSLSLIVLSLGFVNFLSLGLYLTGESIDLGWVILVNLGMLMLTLGIHQLWLKLFPAKKQSLRF